MSDDKATLILQILKDFKSDNCQEHSQIIKRLDKTNGNVVENTAHRLKFTGGMAVLKVLIALGVLSNVAVWLKLFK